MLHACDAVQIKHKLTKAALQDLLYLIKTFIPSIGCKMVASIYRMNGLFSKFFGNEEPKLHYMCNNCGKLLKEGKTRCTSSRACKQGGSSKFAELNIEDKLKELFLGTYLNNCIQLTQNFLRLCAGQSCVFPNEPLNAANLSKVAFLQPKNYKMATRHWSPEKKKGDTVQYYMKS